MPNVINATSTGNGGLITQGDDSGILNIQTNETTAITVDASQNSTFAGSVKTNTLTSASATALTLQSAGTTAITVDTSQIMLMGATSARTSQAKIELTSATNTALSFYMLKNAQVEMAMGFKSSTDTNFYIGTGSSSVGTNGVYLQNTGTSWITNSDERLKENLVPITDAISKVSILRSVIGNFISDVSKTPRPFLIAQDVQQVLPEAIGKSEIDGTEYLGVSYTDTIPLLVAAIKEQQALITAQAETINALTARIVALESRGTV